MSQIYMATRPYPLSHRHLTWLRIGNRAFQPFVALTDPTAPLQVRVTPATGRIEVNRKGMLYAQAFNINGNLLTGQTFAWASLNTSVCTVSPITTDGRTDLSRCVLNATGTPGTATITCTVSGVTQNVIVTVEALQTNPGGGIPFGFFDYGRGGTWSFRYGYGPPFTATVRSMGKNSPSQVSAEFNKARDEGVKIFAWLTGSRDDVVSSPGNTFDRVKWKNNFDASPDISAYIFDPVTNPTGPVVSHMTIDEPNNSFYTQPFNKDHLLECCTHSKARYPNLPCSVRVESLWLRDGGNRVIPDYAPTDMDICWHQYHTRRGTSTQQILDYRNVRTAAAKAMNLLQVEAMNITNGGDGSSGIPGPATPTSQWFMSPAELRKYGSILIAEPYQFAFVMWEWEEAYFDGSHTNLYARQDWIDAQAFLAGLAGVTGGGTARPGEHEPLPNLSTPPSSPVGTAVEFDTGASVEPDQQAFDKFYLTDDGTPLIGPVSSGSPDPVHIFASAGTFAPKFDMVDADGSYAQAVSSIVVGAGAGLYTDPAPLAPPERPEIPLGGSAMSRMNHRVFALADGETFASDIPSLNDDNSRLLYWRGGYFYRTITWGATTTTLGPETAWNISADQRSVHWDPTLALVNRAWWVQNTLPRLHSTELNTGVATLRKDFTTSSTFTNAFGTTGNGLLRLKTDRDGIRWAARVKNISTGAIKGAVVWDKNSNTTWSYKPPSGATIVDLYLTKDGARLILNLDASGVRSMAVMTLATSAVASSSGSNPLRGEADVTSIYAAQPQRTVHFTLSPVSSAQLHYSYPRKLATREEYSGGGVSRLDDITRYTVSTFMANGRLVGPFTLHSGQIYKTLWANELADKSWRFDPEEVRIGLLRLRKASSVADMSAGSWHFGGTNLFIWQPMGGSPALTGLNQVQAFDWRFGIDEIFQINNDATLRGRLCHTHHHTVGFDTVAPQGAASFDGSRVTFTSNDEGTGPNRVLCVLTTPGA